MVEVVDLLLFELDAGLRGLGAALLVDQLLLCLALALFLSPLAAKRSFPVRSPAACLARPVTLSVIPMASSRVECERDELPARGRCYTRIVRCEAPAAQPAPVPPRARAAETPAARGLGYHELSLRTEDGGAFTAGGWRPPPSGSGRSSLPRKRGQRGDRVRHAQLLTRPASTSCCSTTAGTAAAPAAPRRAGHRHRPRSARQALLDEAGEEPIVMGESLGGGVAVKLALEHPPRGLVLQSAFTSAAGHGSPPLPVHPQAAGPGRVPQPAADRRPEGTAPRPAWERDEIVPPRTAARSTTRRRAQAPRALPPRGPQRLHRGRRIRGDGGELGSASCRG